MQHIYLKPKFPYFYSLHIHIFVAELPVAPTTNHLKSYNESSLTTKLDKLQEQQEDLKKQVKALIKTFKKLDKLRNQYEDSKEQIVIMTLYNIDVIVKTGVGGLPPISKHREN